MVKVHNVRIIIDNQSGISMKYENDWFDSGRLADTYSWPDTIENGQKMDILCYERDWALAGCSGYVQYSMNKTLVTFAFSNPSVGTNKLGVDTSAHVWDNMSDNNYSSFDVNLRIGDLPLRCRCSCTAGSTNTATVKITGQGQQTRLPSSGHKIVDNFELRVSIE